VNYYAIIIKDIKGWFNIVIFLLLKYKNFSKEIRNYLFIIKKKKKKKLKKNIKKKKKKKKKKK